MIHLAVLFVRLLRPGAGTRKGVICVALGVTLQGCREVLVFVAEDLPGIEETICKIFLGMDGTSAWCTKCRTP